MIGVGGGGVNTVRRMMRQGKVPGVEYIAVNTDIKSLESLSGSEALCIQIGEHLTRGFGAGGNASIGEKAADEGRYLLKRAAKDAELVFISVGMGGGTGTGAAPVVAQIAKESGALVIAVLTTPFSFEGKRRFDVALAGIHQLRESADNMIIVHNDRLLQFADHNAPITRAFAIADEVVSEGISSVSSLVNVPGEINVDLADVKVVMSIPGIALMGIGRGSGKSAAVEAAEQAISNPLLDINVKGAKGILLNYCGGPDLTLGGVNEAANLIARQVDPNAIIFFGMATPSEELQDQVKVTLIATGIRSVNGGGWISELGEGIRSKVKTHKLSW
jgi:cell division protein FtsZ